MGAPGRRRDPVGARTRPKPLPTALALAAIGAVMLVVAIALDPPGSAPQPETVLQPRPSTSADPPPSAPPSVRPSLGGVPVPSAGPSPDLTGDRAPSTGAPSTGTPSSGGAASTAPPRIVHAPAGAPARRGLLYAIGRSLTPAEADAAPGTYRVVVLNQWDGALAARLKQRDPSVIVLMYQCLASTRESDSTTNRSGGVLYSAAPASWFATDASGDRIEWNGYSGHWQMAVWDPAYQQAWVDNVVSAASAGPWDGILADNDMATLSHYSSALLAGTGSTEASDATLRNGLFSLIQRAGSALQARGKLLVPNISDARLDPGRWSAHTAFGGGMEENFAHWGTSTDSGFIGDWGGDGWIAQTDQMAAPGISLAITRAAPGDRRTLLYGFASVLVRGDADAMWMPSSEAGSAAAYRAVESIPEMGWPLGAAQEPTRLDSGAWTRAFTSAWVAVNPTDAWVTVRPPETARTADGSPAGPQRMGPHTGVVLRRG